jgi:hypothetical protein
MERYNMFLLSVIKSLVQVCLPKNIGQKGMIIYVPVGVKKWIVQVCLSNGVVQNGMIQ